MEMNYASGDLRGWRLSRRHKMLAIALAVLAVPAVLFLTEIGFSGIRDWDPPSVVSPNVDSQELQHAISTNRVTVFSTVTHVQNVPAATETVFITSHSAPKEPAVFTLVMWSISSATEGALLMKSILMYTSVPVDFHIICDDSAHQYLQQRFSLVKHPSYNIRVYFYLPSRKSLEDRVEREGAIKTDHSAGLPGLMKLFIHEIISPEIKKAIYIDTDAFFISDPALLWDTFSRLKPTTVIVMGSHTDQHSDEWHHASRICTCVMLLDLERLREVRLMDSSIYREFRKTGGDLPESLSPPAFRKLYGEPEAGGKYENVRLGDQGYWWAIVDGRPDIFEPLSFDFEVTSCLVDTYMTGLGSDAMTEEEELSHHINVMNTPQEGEVILPKLLHFNCLHGTDVYTQWQGWNDPNNFLNERWGSAVRFNEGYKWIWLNKGKHLKTTLEMIIYQDALFADEQFALDHGITY